MVHEFSIKQIKEGSIIFNKTFGIEVLGCEDNNLIKFIYKVYSDGKIIESKESVENKFFFYPYDFNKYINYEVVVEIYINGMKTIEIKSPILDYIEDFVSVKKVKLEIINNKLVASVESNLNIEKEMYAYYLDRGDDDALVTIWYKKSKTHTFDILGPGNYSVRVFTKIIKNNGKEDMIIKRTNTITIK